MQDQVGAAGRPGFAGASGLRPLKPPSGRFGLRPLPRANLPYANNPCRPTPRQPTGKGRWYRPPGSDAAVPPAPPPCRGLGAGAQHLQRHPVLPGQKNAARVQHLGTALRHFQHLIIGDALIPAALGEFPRVTVVHTVHIGTDAAPAGIKGRGQRHRGGITAARPSVVMSPSRSTPWNPATITIFPASSSRRMRRRCSAVISASAWLPSVWMPACQPVRETAESPLSCRVMAISAADACSPVANSWSASRQAGVRGQLRRTLQQAVGGLSCAETTAIIWKPAAAASASCPAAQRSPAASATEEPPNL